MVNPASSFSIRQRIHIVLLGVDDVARSAAFYESLGWSRSPTSHTGFVKFDLGGSALALISRADLARDALAPETKSPASSALALIYLAERAEDVSKILMLAVASGGTLVKPATKTPYGTAGYFRDPDGHLFEVDHETTWVFDDNHHLVV